MPNEDDASARAVGHLWTLLEARGIDVETAPEEVIRKLAEALDDFGIPYVRDLPLSGFGRADETIDLFLATGVAVLLDVGPPAPNLDRIQRCALPPAVRAIAVLTDRAPEAYPTGHSERHAVHGKFLGVHRIATAS